jgi:hypothetical protein
VGQDHNSLTNLLASKFIQRKDVKAIQSGSAYMPVTDTGKRDGNYIPWSRQDLEDHVTGRKSFGHYLVGRDGQAKLFAFDIDLTKWSERSERPQPTWLPIDADGATVPCVEPKSLQPRDAWLHPKCPPELRRFLIAQMRGVADALARATVELLDVPVAVAYSGNKGLHVYGFTGAAPASDLRTAAVEVLEYSGSYEPLRGKNFYKHTDESPVTGYGCIDVEVFPKQDNLNEKDLGNLMRLPLGKHMKSGQQAFFLNLNSPVDELSPLDPVTALEGGNPWK